MNAVIVGELEAQLQEEKNRSQELAAGKEDAHSSGYRKLSKRGPVGGWGQKLAEWV